MNARDSGTWTKTALLVTLMLGGGLAVATVDNVLRNAGAVTSRSVSAHNVQGVIVASASGQDPGYAPWAPALSRKGDGYYRAPPTPKGSESIVMERAGCTRECLEGLRQRLLDHHRQESPVWVF